ncbi:MAG: hypothetical protein AAF229_15150 [Pseudomonadota bacterium]
MGQSTPPSDVTFDILVSLAREVWVLTDRQLVTEKLLAESGIDLADAIDRYRPDDAFQAMLDARREEFMQRVFGAALED